MNKNARTLEKVAFTLSAVIFALIVSTAPALADTLNLSLTSSTQSGLPGDTLSFNATVSAPSSNSGTIYLNSDNFNLSASGASIDDSGFLFTFPFSLNPGDSFTGELFTVTLRSDLSPGLYNGFFEILGGSDASGLNVIGAVDFAVDQPVPEPSSWLLVASGLAFLGAAYAARRGQGIPVVTSKGS